jgi:hypothetical protein
MTRQDRPGPYETIKDTTRQDKTPHNICPTSVNPKPERTDLGNTAIGKGHSSDRGTGQEMVRKYADPSKQEVMGAEGFTHRNGKGYTCFHSCLCLCVGLGLDLCLFLPCSTCPCPCPCPLSLSLSLSFVLVLCPCPCPLSFVLACLVLP